MNGGLQKFYSLNITANEIKTKSICFATAGKFNKWGGVGVGVETHRKLT